MVAVAVQLLALLVGVGRVATTHGYYDLYYIFYAVGQFDGLFFACGAVNHVDCSAELRSHLETTLDYERKAVGVARAQKDAFGVEEQFVDPTVVARVGVFALPFPVGVHAE